jgi:hypothetical protein
MRGDRQQRQDESDQRSAHGDSSRKDRRIMAQATASPV